MIDNEVKYVFARYWPFNLEGMPVENAIAALQLAHNSIQELGWKDVRVRAEVGYDHPVIVLRGMRPENENERLQRLEDAKVKADHEYNEYLRLKRKYEDGLTE